MPFNFKQPENFGSGLAEGASSALKDFVMPAMAAREQSKLSMQMLSQKIGMEQQAKIGEAGAVSQLQNIPESEMKNIGDQVSSMLNSAQQHKPFAPWDMSAIKSTAGQQAALKQFGDTSAAIGRITGGNRPSQVKSVDQFGNQKIDHYDTYSGQLLSSENGGLTSGAADKISKATTAYHELNSMADRVNNAIQSFQSADGPINAAWQAGKLTLNQLSAADPNAKAFLDTLPQDALSLDKATNGTVRSSPQLSALTAPAIFALNDTKQSSALKVKRMRQIAYDNLDSVYKSNGPTQLPPGAHNPSAEDANAQAAGGQKPQFDFAAEDARRASLNQKPQQKAQ